MHRYTSCSFTGHRQILNIHRDKLAEKLDSLLDGLYTLGCKRFFSGGALGFDTEAALAVLRLKARYPDAKWTLLLPCKNQDAKWSPVERELYRDLLSRADAVEYVSDNYTDGCMRERNLRLAEECDVMVAYLYKDRSGASQTVRMAERLGKDVINVASGPF